MATWPTSDRDITLFVDYRNHDKKKPGQWELEQHTAEVLVRSEERTDWGDPYRIYYATDRTGTWGCGKESRTITGAVQLLVQDQALICAIRSK